MKARYFAGYALLRLGELERASEVFSASYYWMIGQGAYNQALYAAALRTSAAIKAGDFGSAAIWMSNSEAAVRGGAPHQQSPSSGHHSNAAALAMHQGRYDEAESLIFAPGRESSVLSSDRHKAVCLAMSIRLKQMRGFEVDGEELSALDLLYFKGRDLGGQDQIVEALWCARVLSKDETGASKILSDYLLQYRRERSLPDWSLRHTTAADEAWLEASLTILRPFLHKSHLSAPDF